MIITSPDSESQAEVQQLSSHVTAGNAFHSMFWSNRLSLYFKVLFSSLGSVLQLRTSIGSTQCTAIGFCVFSWLGMCICFLVWFWSYHGRTPTKTYTVPRTFLTTQYGKMTR